MQKKRVAFQTLGCKLNFSETSTISRQFGIEHFEIVGFHQLADIYIIHSCSVTAAAEHKCKTAVKQAHRRNPSAKVAVIGCAAQSNPEVFQSMAGVSWVLGNQEKFNLADILNQPDTDEVSHESFMKVARKEVSDISKTRKFLPSYSINDRTRSFFKVQDGCDYFCTFCSIPYMRGRSRSETIENTLKVAREIASTGIKEIVLTGVNIGDFGKQHSEKFIDLLRKLDELEEIKRLRISSIEPELLSDEIINLIATSKRILPHFHIPLQSGSDLILKAMKRKYSREVFADRISKIRQKLPHACIAADVIVGFPGESDEDFQDAFQFIKLQDISYMHIFTYSERPGTVAQRFEGKISDTEKRKRSQKMHELSEEKKTAFYSGNTGKTFRVLWESDSVNGFMQGWTENYIHCRTPYSPDLVNQITTIRISEVIREKELICEVVLL